jgi:hypothetical protein
MLYLVRPERHKRQQVCLLWRFSFCRKLENKQMPTPEELAAAETAKAQQEAEDAKIAAEAKAKADLEAEAFDKERAMKTINNLREIEKQAKKDAAELAALKAEEQKRKDAELSEAEKLKKQLAELEQTNRATMAENAALAAGLPKEWADRLKGSTKAELEADAAEFAKLIPAQQKLAPKINTTNPANAQQTETPEQQRERLFGKQGNPFDLASIKAQGGGVIFNK